LTQTKVFNHILLTLASNHDEQKNKTFLQNSSLKINQLNQLIMKLACPMQHHGKYQSKILMMVLKLKA
jgi:hypothetical protein